MKKYRNVLQELFNSYFEKLTDKNRGNFEGSCCPCCFEGELEEIVKSQPYILECSKCGRSFRNWD